MTRHHSSRIAARLDNDGLTAKEWASQFFAWEYCSECGYDKDDHAYSNALFGNWFAVCLKEPRYAPSK